MRKPLFIARHGRRPSGLLGHLVARIMATETAAENARAVDLLALCPGDRLLEIGCGHGRTIAEAVGRAPDIRATGVDFSAVMLATARHRLRPLIAARQVDLLEADSTALPVRNNLFTAALAVHTVYFWDRPEDHLTEIARVLRPGGRLVLGYHPGDDPAFTAATPEEVYRRHPVAAIEEAFASSGLASVQTRTAHLRRGLMAWTIATKPPTTSMPNTSHLEGETRCV